MQLTPTALGLARDLAQAWQLTGTEAVALLAVSPAAWRRIRSETWSRPLNQDQMTRVSLLGGIRQRLHVLFDASMADRWPRLSRTGSIFGGMSAIAAMVHDGIPFIITVRQQLATLQTDLRRGAGEGAAAHIEAPAP